MGQDTYRPLISEIFKKANYVKTNEERTRILLKYNSQALRSLLIWNYDESVISMLPEGDVPFEKNPAPEGTDHILLEKQDKKFRYFVKGGADVSQMKREEIFLGLVESLHPSEAEVLILVKDKKLQSKYPRISRNVVESTFPQIVWGGRS
jgi:hypothetical protein